MANSGRWKLSLPERFWSNVRVDSTAQCWLWLGFLDSTGRGRCWVKEAGRSVLAHRLAYELANGSIPAGLLVCHHCDNPTCVNPRHLYVGDQKQNMGDCVQRGRIARGAAHSALMRLVGQHGMDHYNSKLTERDVRDIRAATERQRDIAAKYGIAQSCVSKIKNRIGWAHVV